MKFLSHQILGLAALPLLALLFGLLFVLTLRARRGTRLYRLRVALLGLIVTLWGVPQTGCGNSSRTCYTTIQDWSVDEDQALEPKEEALIDPFPEPTCYLPMDPPLEWEVPPDAVEDDGDPDALDASEDGDAAEEADEDEDAAEDAADETDADADGDEVE